MKKLVVLVCVVLSTWACKQQNEGTVKVISPEEAQSLLQMDNVQLVDVRTPEEFDEGYIPLAQNIDFRSPTFDEDISKLDKEKPVILYCKSGGRSAKCAEKLSEAGFVKIYDIDGGISKWEHKGYEIKVKS